MGIETAIFVGLQAINAISTMSAARKEAKAVTREAELQAGNKARETALRAARQKVSFLNSGLTLDGTPQDVLSETFSTGLADINQIGANANTKSKSIIGGARSKVISDIAGSAANSSFGSSLFSTDYFGTGPNSMLSQSTNMADQMDFGAWAGA